jgi:hypothetical protein
MKYVSPRLKTVSIVFTISLSSILIVKKSNAQNSFYWPNGKPFITKENNVLSHLDSIGIKTRHDFNYKNTVVFYYSLSKEPAFVLSDRKSEIPEALKSYNHKKYLSSRDFEQDIKGMIEKVALDTAYALEVLGKPTIRKPGEESYSQTWVYKKYNLKLVFEFQNAVRYDSKVTEP